MGVSMTSAFLIFAVFFLAGKYLRRNQTISEKLRPPSPSILYMLRHLWRGYLSPFRSHRGNLLVDLSRRYGPVVYLPLGSRPTLLVSSPSAAEEVFAKNDVVFANRPDLVNTRHVHYGATTLATVSYGPYWTKLRRFTTHHVFSASAVGSFAGVREGEVRALLRRLLRGGGGEVDARAELSELSFNVMMRMISGKTVHGGDREQLERLVDEALGFSSITHLQDYFPVLGWVSGVEKKMIELRKRMDRLLQGVIETHGELTGGGEEGKEEDEEKKQGRTVVDVLLEAQSADGDFFTQDVIYGILQVLMTAGIDTAWGTMEWAISLLLNHPETLKAAREEVDAVAGHRRLLDSSDHNRLPYVQAVVKETLRLYPPGALLLPHVSSRDCTVEGYAVPAGTMLLVNAYGIHRNPEIWPAPAEFRPERFWGGGNVEGCRWIPFGSGRRRCPGEGAVVHLMVLALGSLIQCFEWERTAGEEAVDMAPEVGSLLMKAKPLKALCRPRDAMRHVLAQL